MTTSFLKLKTFKLKKKFNLHFKVKYFLFTLEYTFFYMPLRCLASFEALIR